MRWKSILSGKITNSWIDDENKPFTFDKSFENPGR